MSDTTDSAPPKNKGGRPRRKPTPEMVARARHLIGRMVYAARVVQQLQRRYQCSRALGYRAVALAQKELRDELAGTTGTDPAALCYAGLLSIASNSQATEGERCRAWGSIVKLLGVRAVADLSDDDATRKLLAEIAARQAARSVKAKTPNEEHDNGT